MLVWAASSIAAAVALFWVPVLLGAQREAIAAAWRAQLAAPGLPLRDRARYWLAHVRAWIVAALLFWFGLSYLYLAAIHCGVLVFPR